jgi:uncharacterized protein
LAQFTAPPNDGFVTDVANALTDEQKAALSQTLTQYQKDTSNEIAILVLPNLSGMAIEDVGVTVGRAWGIGDKQKNNGILIIVALEERETRMEVGYGLEGAVPDLVAKGIIEEDMAPAFRQGDYFGGLTAAIASLQKHIAGEYTADRYTKTDASGFGGFFFFLVIIGIQISAAWLGRTKSYWLGGVLGGVLGIILILFSFSFFVVPALVVAGLAFDFVVSRMMPPPGRRGRRGGGFGGFGGGGFGGGSMGGGGFGGGSFGGGGASGKW